MFPGIGKRCSDCGPDVFYRYFGFYIYQGNFSPSQESRYLSRGICISPSGLRFVSLSFRSEIRILSLESEIRVPHKMTFASPTPQFHFSISLSYCHSIFPPNYPQSYIIPTSLSCIPTPSLVSYQLLPHVPQLLPLSILTIVNLHLHNPPLRNPKIPIPGPNRVVIP
jgi:hypothetical protein